MSSLTIGNQVGSTQNNFTFLRLLAAYAVLFAHCYDLSTGHIGQNPITQFIYGWWGQGLGTVAVVVFFVVSGFLISASYLHRDNVFAFFEARFLRIFPALIVAVLFCVFVVGLWDTNLITSDYLNRPATWSFVWHNMTLLGGVSYRLPGVFDANPYPFTVNGSLWTLPVELYMYAMVMLIGALGVLKERASFNTFIVVFAAILFALQQKWFQIPGIPVKHAGLMMAYIAGVFYYVNRAFVPLNYGMLTFVVVILFLLHSTVLWSLAQVFGFAYVILFIALHPSIKLPNIDKYGDYSYGVYIYAFPVQQLLASHLKVSPIEMLVYTTVVVLPLAMLSWKLVEKPALKLKGKMPMGKRWLDYRVRGIKK